MFVIVVYQPSDRSSFLRHLNHNITFGKSGMVHIYILHKNMRIHNTNRYISLLKAIAIITIKSKQTSECSTHWAVVPLSVRSGQEMSLRTQNVRISAESNCLDIPSVHQKEIHLVSRGEAPGGGRM